MTLISTVDRHTYTGPVDVETRKFKVARADVLLNVFGGEHGWADLYNKDYAQLPIVVFASPGANLVGRKVEITIQNDNNICLKGYYVAQQGNIDDMLHVVFFSGSGGCAGVYGLEVVKGYFKPRFRKYVGSVLMVDYRGFYPSVHSLQTNISNKKNYVPHPAYMPGSKALYTDALAMIDYLVSVKKIDARKILLHGFSLGSGPATEMATRFKNLAGLMLHGPMESIKANAANSYSGFKKIAAPLASAVADANVGFRNINKIKNVNCPIVISCGRYDKEMWPQAQKLAKEAKTQGKTLLRVEHGGTHLSTNAMFLDSYQRSDKTYTAGPELEKALKALYDRAYLKVNY